MFISISHEASKVSVINTYDASAVHMHARARASGGCSLTDDIKSGNMTERV